tara:strand:+ start:284 stop:898 length:615 start_codon:yes stop_codon:yes gene_type:complete
MSRSKKAADTLMKLFKYLSPVLGASLGARAGAATGNILEDPEDRESAYRIGASIGGIVGGVTAYRGFNRNSENLKKTMKSLLEILEKQVDWEDVKKLIPGLQSKLREAEEKLRRSKSQENVKDIIEYNRLISEIKKKIKEYSSKRVSAQEAARSKAKAQAFGSSYLRSVGVNNVLAPTLAAGGGNLMVSHLKRKLKEREIRGKS